MCPLAVTFCQLLVTSVNSICWRAEGRRAVHVRGWRHLSSGHATCASTALPAESPAADGAVPAESRRVSTSDIQLVQNLIERCLQMYMSQKEVVSTLQSQAKIEPGFTGLVWQVTCADCTSNSEAVTLVAHGIGIIDHQQHATACRQRVMPALSHH